MLSLIRTLTYILRHPLNRRQPFRTLWRFGSWQVSQRLFPAPVIWRFANDSRLVVEKGMRGATLNIYCGLSDFEEMSFLLHFLRPDDLFLDVGANVGAYSVLASSAVGASTLAFEPVDQACRSWMNNIAINHAGGRARLVRKGVGAKRALLRFTNTQDTVNRVIPSGSGGEGVEVECTTLDLELSGNRPRLMKIDVEGYELDVLRGAQELLASAEFEAVIIELSGHGTQYGSSDQDVHATLSAHGFRPFQYLPFERKLVLLGAPRSSGNTIYLRNSESAAQRVASAPEFSVGDVRI